MGEPPKPNTRACSMPQRSRASRGGSMPSAHSRGRKKNSTWRTWLASWSSGTGPKNLNYRRRFDIVTATFSHIVKYCNRILEELNATM